MFKSIITTALIVSFTRAGSIFDDDSEFMKGFETGIIMRTSESKVEDYGCSVPKSVNRDLQNVVKMMTGALDTVKMFIPDDVNI